MKRERKKFKVNISPYTFIFPNLFTTGNLFCGFYSIVMSLNHHYAMAAYLILSATLFDMFDGRIARMLKVSSAFGKEYDSLADIVSFGVAPAVLTYMWAFWGFSRIGWLVSFLFVACGALRLARFNVISSHAGGDYFLGLPIPVAGSTMAAFYLFYRELALSADKTFILLIMMFVGAFLMVSRVRYPSFKKINVPMKNQNDAFSNMVVMVLMICLIAVNPDILLFPVLAAYVAAGIAGWVLYPLKKSQTQENVPASYSKKDQI